MTLCFLGVLSGLVAVLLGCGEEAHAFGRARARPRPALMAVLGDSISAGTLADVPIPQGDTPEERVEKWGNQAISTQAILTNKFSYSWASGFRIQSQYRLLLDWIQENDPGRRLDILNVSWPGHRAINMADQAYRVTQIMSSRRYETLYYVTLLVGANDACAGAEGTPPEKVREQVALALATLATIKQKERIRIMVVSVPRIPDLALEHIRNSRSLFGLTCEKVRNQILKFCNSRLLWESDTEYQESMRIVEGVNQALQEAVREANSLYPHLDVRYTPRFYNYELSVDVLAADCFHPNPQGQELLSSEVWKDQPWFKN